MLQVKYDREQILHVIENVTKKTLDMDLTWDWPGGVAYYGVSRAYQTTGNQEILDRLVKWADEYIELGSAKLDGQYMCHGPCAHHFI